MPIKARGSRFIPACAGNSARKWSPDATLAVHPRLRGELNVSQKSLCKHNGSSPLARGTQFKNFPGTHPSRFIPACAGNSLHACAHQTGIAVHPRLRGELAVSFSRLLIRSVHPRLRGELDSRNAGKIGIRGSSPLARGTQSGYSEGHNVLRFIPACAGNSSKVENTEVSGTVHPRLRGELKKY